MSPSPDLLRNEDSQDSVISTEKFVPPQDFVEGGPLAWLTVIGGTMVVFSTFGVIQAFGVFQDYYTRIYLNDRTPSEISWIGSAQICLVFAMSILSGRLFDAGYFHHVMATGSFIYVFSLFMLSLAKPHQFYQIFLSQGIGLGIGMGLLFLPSVSVVSHHFRARRSLAMGCVSAGSSLGGVVYPISWNKMFHGRIGFAWGVRAIGFLVFGLLLISKFIMKTKQPNRNGRAADANPAPSIRKIISDTPYMICVFGGALVFWGTFFPFFYLQLLAVEHGLKESLAFYSITTMNAASFFGRILLNFLGDITGPFNVMIPTCLCCGILIFAMFKATTAGGLLSLAILFGFFSGGVLSLISPVLANFAASANEIGLRIGISMLVMSFFILTGTPIDGALLRAPRYLWYRPIVFSGVVVIAGTLLLILSRAMLVKRKRTWKV